jgi:hypothetical protein
MAINTQTNELLDPFYGKNDIENKILRATDIDAFTEDALRILRGIQFSCRFNFTIEENTMIMIRSCAHLVKNISGERILEEFEKILNNGGDTLLALKLIHETGLDVILLNNEIDISKLFKQVYVNLDRLSFYHILGSYSDTRPSIFYGTTLKGNYLVKKGLEALENFKYTYRDDRSKFDYNVFCLLGMSPLIKDCVILTDEVKEVVKLMKDGIIPVKMGDIPVNGDDVIKIKPGINGIDIGNVIKKLYKDALNKKFNWTNRENSLKHLNEIMFNF